MATYKTYKTYDEVWPDGIPAIGRAVVITPVDPTPIADSIGEVPAPPADPEPLISGLVGLASLTGHPDPGAYEEALRATDMADTAEIPRVDPSADLGSGQT